MVILIVSSIEWSYLKVTLMVRISYDLQLFDNDDAKIRLLSENKAINTGKNAFPAAFLTHIAADPRLTHAIMCKFS